MGCKGSKLDDQEAVALCRARAELLAAAVRHRYALADAHAALADSIDSVAAPLHRLLRLQAQPRGLVLPSARKGGGAPSNQLLPRSFDPSSALPAHGRSSQLQFGASPGSEPASPADSPPRRRVPEQLQHPHPHYAAYGYDYATQPAYAYPAPAGSLQFYYARSRPPPASVAVTQRAPGTSERVHFGSFDAAGGYPQHYAYSAQRAQAPPPVAPLRSAPPSPPKASSWDFLNVFENYDSYEHDSYYYDSATAPAAPAAPYMPSRSSREVREEEGIPDLEDDGEEDSVGVVVKEVAGQYSAPGNGGARSRRNSLGGASSTAELDQPENAIAHKDVIGEFRRRPTAHGNVSVHAPPPPARRVVDNASVAGEIKAQLVRTAEAARQLAPMLEVGRPSYQGRSSLYQCQLVHLVYFVSNLTWIVSNSLCHWVLNSLISFLKDDVGYLRGSFGVQRHGRVGRRSGREDGGHAEPILGT
jgi:hypothetical protein